MIPKVRPASVVFDKPVHWFRHLREVRTTVVRVEVEIKRINIYRSPLDKNDHTGSSVLGLARPIRSFSVKPGRESCHIIDSGQRDLPTAHIIQDG